MIEAKEAAGLHPLLELERDHGSLVQSALRPH